MPNNKNPVANEPIKKYFSAASFEDKLLFLLPAKIYKLIDKISIPKNNITKFEYDTIKNAPIIVKSNREVISANGTSIFSAKSGKRNSMRIVLIPIIPVN